METAAKGREQARYVFEQAQLVRNYYCRITAKMAKQRLEKPILKNDPRYYQAVNDPQSPIKTSNLKLSLHLLDKIQKVMFDNWANLTGTERETVMFILFERNVTDHEFVGPLGQLVLDVYVRRFMTPDFAIRFLQTQDKRLN